MFTPDTYTLFKKFTFIFNVFVMLQIFNFLNARKIQDEVNIFKNFFNNRLFFVILAIILLGQAVIVTFTGFAFGLYPYYGLNGQQWYLILNKGDFDFVWVWIDSLGISTKIPKRRTVFRSGNKRNRPIRRGAEDSAEHAESEQS